MHAYSDYANQAYGRMVADPLGGWTLQYWLFYYYNPKTYFTFGAHEGDWELVQIHLDANYEPTDATYSQHGWGEKCEWTHVQRTPSERPIVYVAEGSHASYFSSGYHANPAPGEPWKVADDYANGDGETVTPFASDMTGDLPPWLAWPGRWGGSDSSPRGPAEQGNKWTNPEAWSAGVKDCTEEQTQALSGNGVEANQGPAPAPPVLPEVTAEREGDEVVFRYRFPKAASQDEEPWTILTSVDPAGSKFAPLTERTLVAKSGRGTVRQSAGLGRKGVQARVSVLTKEGGRSRTVTVPLRDERP